MCSHTQKSGATLVCLPQPEPVTARPTEFAIPRAQDCQSGEKERGGTVPELTGGVRGVRPGQPAGPGRSPAGRLPSVPQLCKFSLLVVAGGVGGQGGEQGGLHRSHGQHFHWSALSLGNQWSKFYVKMEKIKIQIS